jgi:hypothetical protein
LNNVSIKRKQSRTSSLAIIAALIASAEKIVQLYGRRQEHAAACAHKADLQWRLTTPERVER